MAKPIGPICNLDCAYCYYLHKEELYPGTTSWRMPAETLETYIRQLIAAQPPGTPELTFAWQGGEPTLLGVEFFQRVVELQRRHAPAGMRIANALQTNGTLLDDAWGEFFRQHHVLIGLSLDGPADLHDRYRYDRRGQGSFAETLRGLQVLKRHRVPFNALVVVNRHNGDHGRRVYTYLRDNGVEYFQFIPIVERRGVGAHAEPLVQLTLHANDAGLVAGSSAAGGPAAPSTPGVSTKVAAATHSAPAELVSSRSVLPEQYGRFLCEIFDEWVRRDVGRVFVQVFDQAVAAWLGQEPSLCVFRQQCGRALAIEHNGDLYSCDHFVEPEYLLGNIHTTSLAELANSERQRAFGAAKETTLPQFCRQCDVRFVCNGECPKNRFLTTPLGEPGLNYLCGGYQMFFRHIAPAMELMVGELRAGRSAANVMPHFRGKGASPSAAAAGTRSGNLNLRESSSASRPPVAAPPRANALCPCGSGRKFKKCCGRG